MRWIVGQNPLGVVPDSYQICSLTMNPLHLIVVAFAVVSPALAQNKWKPDKDPKLIPPAMFTLADPSLEVTVWATSPLLHNPTNMDIDHAGRIWVAEGVNYRGRNGTRPEGDRIVVLQDTDGDGKCDRSHTFVQEKSLIAPLGVAVFDNVVYVAQPPDMLAYTDVNRDLKFDPAVDKREVILTGFNAINHDHGLHSLTAGPDGKFYFNNGNCGAVFTDKSGKTFYLGGTYGGTGGSGRWTTSVSPGRGRMTAMYGSPGLPSAWIPTAPMSKSSATDCAIPTNRP